MNRKIIKNLTAQVYKEKIMKIGQRVAWRSFNPMSKSIRFGVVCLDDDDWGNPDRPAGGYDVVSIKKGSCVLINNFFTCVARRL